MKIVNDNIEISDPEEFRAKYKMYKNNEEADPGKKVGRPHIAWQEYENLIAKHPEMDASLFSFVKYTDQILCHMEKLWGPLKTKSQGEMPLGKKTDEWFQSLFQVSGVISVSQPSYEPTKLQGQYKITEHLVNYIHAEYNQKPVNWPRYEAFYKLPEPTKRILEISPSRILGSSKKYPETKISHHLAAYYIRDILVGMREHGWVAER